VRASVPDASWRDVPGMSHWEETPGKTQDTQEGLCPSAGLGTPQDPPRRAERSVCGDGGLEVDQGLFTDSYCKVCSAQLISESQRVAHYESRKHANKVRLYYMLHPVDGGCPAKKLRTDNGSDDGDVDKNKCCTLCNMSFTSAVVAQSHYQGKIHAKRLKLLLGEQPAITNKGKSSALWEMERDSDRYCQLCNAWFNNPGMAQQHYDGKKNLVFIAFFHRFADPARKTYSCEVCGVTLNSVAQYHAHLQGSKHQNKTKPGPCTSAGLQAPKQVNPPRLVRVFSAEHIHVTGTSHSIAQSSLASVASL
uniref:C2H2-type domain-containing protein n=1 Tax=Periophthalmus magnuspinnatus TaxID=409849 RepID=A0A3B3ZB20_9GOBI